MIPSKPSLVCLLCGSKEIASLWEGSDKKFRGQGRFTYVRCRGCGLVFLYPRPSDQEMAQYYPDHVTPVGTDAGPFSLKRTRQRLKRMVAEEWYGYSPGPLVTCRWPVRLLRKVFTFPLRPLLCQVPRQRPGGRVLDIGCGSGGYLAFLASLGWTCEGVEPGPNSRAYAQEVLGLAVHPGPLTARRFPEEFFDVVTMWHVIEHLPDPLETLREVRRVLKPDGVLMVRTPNVESLEARLFRGNWYGLDPPRHFYVFSPSTIRAILERIGFGVTLLRYLYHPHDCSRSLLYVLEDRGSHHVQGVVARYIRHIELGLAVCSPLRRVFGHGGAIQVEARKVSS